MSWLGKLKEVFQRSPVVSLDERRRAPRLDCELEATCRTEERELHALVLDLSSTGMRLRLNRTLRKGAQVRVSCTPHGVMQGRQRLVCRVSWVRPLSSGGAEAGLHIEDSTDNRKHSWVGPALRSLCDSELSPRKHRRFETSQIVGVGMTRQHAYAVLVDLSLGGAQLQLDKHLPTGTSLTLELPAEGGAPAVVLAGRVVDSMRNNQAQFSTLRLKFFKLEPEQEQALRAHLQALAREEQSEALLAA